MVLAGCDSMGLIALWMVVAGAACILFPDLVVALRGREAQGWFGGHNDRGAARRIGIGNVVVGLLALSLSAMLGHFCQFPARSSTFPAAVVLGFAASGPGNIISAWMGFGLG